MMCVPSRASESSWNIRSVQTSADCRYNVISFHWLFHPEFQKRSTARRRQTSSPSDLKGPVPTRLSNAHTETSICSSTASNGVLGYQFCKASSCRHYSMTLDISVSRIVCSSFSTSFCEICDLTLYPYLCHRPQPLPEYIRTRKMSLHGKVFQVLLTLAFSLSFLPPTSEAASLQGCTKVLDIALMLMALVTLVAISVGQ